MYWYRLQIKWEIKKKISIYGKEMLEDDKFNVLENKGCFKKSFTTVRAYINLFGGHIKCLNSHNVVKHTKSYLGQIWFNVTSSGNAGCLKMNFTTLRAYINVFRGHVKCFE
jgi:hypothetical protein